MARLDRDALKDLARKYIWWQTPEEAAADPARVIAQVMDIGDFEDARALAERAGDELLREVLLHAGAGQFRPRSWTYWHYRLGLCRAGESVPPPPARALPR